MKRQILIGLAVLLGLSPDFLFGASPKSFRTLHLEMDKNDAEVLFRKEPQDDSLFPVTLVDSDQRLSGTIEVTGKTTRHFIKKSLLVKLNKNGPKWQGQHQKISLRSLSTDFSRMRDALAWDLFASLGMVVPDVEHVWLFINDEPIGLYLFIEWITPKVIARFGLGDDGAFFHPNDSVYCGDMTLVNQPRLEQCFFKLSKGGDYTPLRNLIEEINQTPVEEFDRFLDKNFHADSVINWLILNTLVGNGDTYNKNYFIYWSKKTGQWVVIPWDFDLSFGRNADPARPFPYSILNDNYQYFYPPELGAFNPLKEKTLKNPQLLARFKSRLSHILGLTDEGESQKARTADMKEGFWSAVRAFFSGFWKGNEAQKVATQNKPGFGLFHPDLFNEKITALEKKIRENIAPERYRGAKGSSFDQEVEALRIYNQWRYAVLKKMILEPTPFNTVHWHPYLSYPLFTPLDPTAPLVRQRVPLYLSTTVEVQRGDRPMILMEEFLARPIGIVDIQEMNQPARLRLEVETERPPDSTPPGIDRAQCIERSWYFDVKTPEAILTANIQVDYLQENSLRHEIGPGITDETALSLWGFQNEAWRKIPTVVNPIVNILKAEGIELKAGNLLILVACQDKTNGSAP